MAISGDAPDCIFTLHFGNMKPVEGGEAAERMQQILPCKCIKKKSDLLAEAGQDELDIASLKVIKVRKHYILSCRAKRLKMNFTKLIEFLFEV